MCSNHKYHYGYDNYYHCCVAFLFPVTNGSGSTDVSQEIISNGVRKKMQVRTIESIMKLVLKNKTFCIRTT